MPRTKRDQLLIDGFISSNERLLRLLESARNERDILAREIEILSDRLNLTDDERNELLKQAKEGK